MMNEVMQKAFEEGAAEQRRRNASKEKVDLKDIEPIDPDCPYCFGNIHIEKDGEIITSCLACKFKKRCLKDAIQERKNDKVFMSRLQKATKRYKK